MLGTEIGLDAANGEVHDREAPRGVVALLSVDADIANPAAVFEDKFFRLHEHAARTAAGIIDAAFVGAEHFHNNPNHAAWGVELSSVFSLRRGEAGEEIFIHAPKQINGAMGFCIVSF